jgi:curved DNA-binding protein CbpA
MERFKDISEAYWILKDAQRRKKYDVSLPDPKKEVRTYKGPPPWERWEEEEWIWDDRQLRYRKKHKDERGMYEARTPFSSRDPSIVFYKKTPWDRFVERVQKATQPYRFFFGKRWRIFRLRYILFLDWLLRRRYHAKKPHKIRNPRLD